MNYRQIYAIKARNEARIKKLCPTITNESGIYILTRTDEQGFKFAYIGQSVNLLERCASHLNGYQHIDLSIKKHGLYDSIKYPYGWKIAELYKVPKNDLDEAEMHYIKVYANAGYQLRNKTGGSQGDGKKGISYMPRKGYLQGKNEGKAQAYKEIGELIEKYTNGLTSKKGKIAERKTAELLEKLKGG